MKRIFLVLLVGLVTSVSYGQTLDKLLINGRDWRMCGDWEKRDTITFYYVKPNTTYFTCDDSVYTQLLVYEGLQFRILNWENNICFINTGGQMEFNDDNGEFRFYFDDGLTMDFILLYADKKKVVLVNKRY